MHSRHHAIPSELITPRRSAVRPILQAAAIAAASLAGASSLVGTALAQGTVEPEIPIVTDNISFPLLNHQCIVDTPEIVQATWGIHPLSENDLFGECDPRRPFCVRTEAVYRTGYKVVTLKQAQTNDDLILQNGDPYTTVELAQNYTQSSDHKMRAAAIGNMRIVFKTESLFGSGRFCTSGSGTSQNFVGGTVACREGTQLTDAKRNFLTNVIAPRAGALLGSFLSVDRVQGNLFVPSSRVCGTQYVVNQADVTAGVPNADLVVYLSGAPSSPGVIAWAGSCATDSRGRPTIAKINVVPEFLDPNSNEIRTDYITRVIVHELMHTLGFNGGYMGSTQMASGRIVSSSRRGKTVSLFNGARTVEAARAYYQCNSIDGVEIEDEGAAGTSGSHWERRYAYDDVMSGIAGRQMFFSAVTLAVFQDTGKYFVDFNAAEEPAFLKGGGCNVITQSCGTSAGGMGSWFCNTAGAQCTRDRLSIGQCNFGTFASDLPVWARYFSSPRQGGTEALMDYCPIVGGFSNRLCNDATSNTADNTQGFYYGTGGRCWDTSADLIANGWNFGASNPGPARCFQSRCLNGRQVQFKVGSSDWISCPADGSVSTIPSSVMQANGYTGTVTCPLASTFCTGDLLVGTTAPPTTTTTTTPTTTTRTTTTTPTTTTTTTRPPTTTTTTTRPPTTTTTTTRPPTTTPTTTVPPTPSPTTAAPTTTPTPTAANCNYLLPAGTQGQSASLSVANINQILKRHNDARAAVSPYAVDMPMLQWSRDLAATAQTYLDQCPGMRSSPQSGRLEKLGYWYIGENMVGGPTAPLTPAGIEIALDAWIGANKSWTYPNTCAPGVYCGAYQQVIWSGTTQIGCAYKQCNDRYAHYWVCNYGVGGNVVGVNPYQSTPYLSKSATCTADRFAPAATDAPSDQCRASYALTGSSPNSVLTTDQINQLLDGHNQLRRTVTPFARTMPMLKWNQRLADYAQSYLNQCPGLRTSPSQNRLYNRDFPQWWWIGENMVAGENLTPAFTDDVINAWADGKGGFRYGSSCLAGYYCDSYTNMVWADTTDIGCAYRFCPNESSVNKHFWVCSYGVGGNVQGANPYQSTANRNEAAACTLADQSTSSRRMHAMDADGSQMMRSGRVMNLAGETIDMALAAKAKEAL